MDPSTFIVAVFCLIDDRLKDLGRLRERGPTPTLCDSEVLTIEVVGEFLGLDEDTELFEYFRRHYAHFFPNLLLVHRTTFTRQAANLWKVKRSEEHTSELQSRQYLVCRLLLEKKKKIISHLLVYY